MKTLVFSKTGEKHVINCDITIFSDRIRIMPDKFETIVLEEIQNKHCAIYKDDQIYKLIDLCSFNTKLFTKEDIRPKLLKPLTFYELRNSDTIFIGEHEIVFHSEPDEIDKQSFYVPETQEIEQDFQMQDTVVTDDIEIPETQEITPDFEIETQKKTQFIEPETAKSLKKAAEKLRNEFLVETQPVLNVLPPNTRRYTAKQNEIKPKTVPLSIFDFNTQALNAETEALTFTQLMKDNNPKKKIIKKRKSEPTKGIKKEGIKNSVLLSDTESDSDDDRSKISAASVKYADQCHPKFNNSLSQCSINTINDDSFMGDIRTTDFDSQFLEQVNSSCNMENCDQNSELSVVKEEDKKESNKNLTKQENEIEIKPAPRKRIKLFKFVSSDEE